QNQTTPLLPMLRDALPHYTNMPHNPTQTKMWFTERSRKISLSAWMSLGPELFFTVQFFRYSHISKPADFGTALFV
ncbi:MAG: hypothetical protein WAK26_11960, partial [Terracidiphilus sp.]